MGTRPENCRKAASGWHKLAIGLSAAAGLLIIFGRVLLGTIMFFCAFFLISNEKSMDVVWGQIKTSIIVFLIFFGCMFVAMIVAGFSSP